MKIEIGNKSLSELTTENLIDIALIEGICFSLEYFERPKLVKFADPLLDDTSIVFFNQKRKRDDFFTKTVIFFFDYGSMSYHWVYYLLDSDGTEFNIKIDTIKYLIKEGFDVPVYQ